MNDSPDLFGNPPTPVPAPIAEVRDTDSADVRRTKRQLADITAHRHPLTRGPLHADAPNNPKDGDAPGERCGTCIHRAPTTHHGKSFPKCQAHDGRHLTRGASTDVRAWWPACEAHETRPR